MGTQRWGKKQSSATNQKSNSQTGQRHALILSKELTLTQKLTAWGELIKELPRMRPK